METLMKILLEIDETIDWKNEKALIDDRLLDSFGVISLISEMEDAFDVEIDAAELVPENMNTVEAMWNMIQRLKES